MVGCFDTLLKHEESVRIFCVWVCTLDYLCFKKAVKSGRKNGRSIGDILKSERGQIQNPQT